MDRRLFAFFASVAVMVGAAGYLLAQSRTNSTEIAASPVTLLSPQASPTTSAPAPVASSVRSTLPPTPAGEVFQYAAGGGCTPGTNTLPDGEYYGSVVLVNEDRTLDFNLKCLFLADELPPDFDELYATRFPGEEFANTGFDLVDVAATERRIRFTWNSQHTVNGGLYVGDEAYTGFLQRDQVPFDATITIVDGLAVTVTEIVSPG